MTTLVHSDHLALWDISLEEIGILAEENTPRILPYHISSIESTLNQLEMEDIVETEALPSVALYVLTNSRGINGAACMLYPRVLKEFAESLGEDLIILPSSIHEVLLTPSNVSLPPEELNEMVQAISRMCPLKTACQIIFIILAGFRAVSTCRPVPLRRFIPEQTEQ